MQKEYKYILKIKEWGYEEWGEDKYIKSLIDLDEDTLVAGPGDSALVVRLEKVECEAANLTLSVDWG